MLANEVGVGSLLCFRPCLRSGMHSDRITECSHVHLPPSQAQSGLVGCWCLVKLCRIVKHQSGPPLTSQGCFGLSHCASPHEYCVSVSTTRPTQVTHDSSEPPCDNGRHHFPQFTHKISESPGSPGAFPWTHSGELKLFIIKT